MFQGLQRFLNNFNEWREPAYDSESRTYLNQWGWRPGGYVSRADERAMAGAMMNLRFPSARYAQLALVQHLDRGDESFGGNAYEPVPVVVAGREQQAFNIHASTDPHWPYQQRPPSMTQLAQSLYERAGELWDSIRQQTATDWDEN